MKSQSTHVAILDPLRGFAALAVCLFHFACGNPEFLPKGSLVRQVGGFGHLGVAIFFVISGFILPYAMHQRDHRWKDSASFLIRRLKRLEPPYFCCIFMTIGLNFVGAMMPWYQGAPPRVEWPLWLAHIGYLNAILGYEWVNMVFWTLAIEFQYYFFILLVFRLIAHERARICMVSVLGVAACAFLGFGKANLLPHWLPLFAVGMAAFLCFCGRISLWQYGILMVGCGMVGAWILGWDATCAGLATSAVIVGSKNREMPSWLMPLGRIGVFSYSLYLVHLPLGARLVHWSERHLPMGWARYAALLAVMGVSMGIAWVFWKFIERPAQSWAAGNRRKSL